MDEAGITLIRETLHGALVVVVWGMCVIGALIAYYIWRTR